MIGQPAYLEFEPIVSHRDGLLRLLCGIFTRRRVWLVGGGVMFAMGVSLVVLKRTQDAEPGSFAELNAAVVGNDYRLYFRYPGEDGVLDTQDDRFGTRDFYVPAGADVRLRLNSRDYIYLIEVPHVGIYEIAAPDLDFDVQFAAPQPGQHELLGSQMCGYDHPELLGKLIVQSPAEFRRTMNRLSQVPLPMAQK